eukprot:1161917-Pelagomonas_calceolata.AAC.13
MSSVKDHAWVVMWYNAAVALNGMKGSGQQDHVSGSPDREDEKTEGKRKCKIMRSKAVRMHEAEIPQGLESFQKGSRGLVQSSPEAANK